MMTAFKRSHNFLQSIEGFIFLPRCISCSQLVSTANSLCGACFASSHFIGAAVCNMCGIPLVGDAEGTDLCDTCLHSPHSFTAARAAFMYFGPLRASILSFKHSDRLDLLPYLHRELVRAARGFDLQDHVVMPVPLGRMRLLKRRFNQAELLARGLGRGLGLKVVPDAIVRHKSTSLQLNLSRLERRQNQQGSIFVRRGCEQYIFGKKVVVVDDVMTTGATLDACAEALFQHGAKDVKAVVLARVAKTP
jgi:ComF family protein